MSTTPRVDAFAWSVFPTEVDKAKVTQCALSRICGACGASLGRPIAFLGTLADVERNRFHTPPLHEGCAEALRPEAGADWAVALTAGFEFVRPTRHDEDRRPVFVPNSLL